MIKNIVKYCHPKSLGFERLSRRFARDKGINFSDIVQSLKKPDQTDHKLTNDDLRSLLSKTIFPTEIPPKPPQSTINQVQPTKILFGQKKKTKTSQPDNAENWKEKKQRLIDEIDWEGETIQIENNPGWDGFLGQIFWVRYNISHPEEFLKRIGSEAKSLNEYLKFEVEEFDELHLFYGLNKLKTVFWSFVPKLKSKINKTSKVREYSGLMGNSFKFVPYRKYKGLKSVTFDQMDVSDLAFLLVQLYCIGQKEIPEVSSQTQVPNVISKEPKFRKPLYVDAAFARFPFLTPNVKKIRAEIIMRKLVERADEWNPEVAIILSCYLSLYNCGNRDLVLLTSLMYKMNEFVSFFY